MLLERPQMWGTGDSKNSDWTAGFDSALGGVKREKGRGIGKQKG